MDTRSIDDIAARQYCLVTREQLLAFLTVDQLERWLAQRRLFPVRPGVYRLAGGPPSWEQSLLAVCLSTGAVASHRSAARVWGIEGIPALRPEVSVPNSQRVRLQGVRAHRITVLSPFVTRHIGIPVTTVARTLLDLSAVVSDHRVADAVDYCLRHGLMTHQQLVTCFEVLAGRGRRRIAHFRAILESQLPECDLGDSELEARVARWLVAGGLPRPVAQHPVLAGEHRYLVDLAYPDARIATNSMGGAPTEPGAPSTGTGPGARPRAERLDPASVHVGVVQAGRRPHGTSGAGGLVPPDSGHLTPL